MKNIFQSIALFFTVVLLSSCLKSDQIIGPDAPNSAGAIIEFDNVDYIASGSATASVTLARYAVTVPKGTASPLKVRVNYVGTGKSAPSDITVGLGIDAVALTTHNTQAGRTAANSWNLIPAAWYQLPASVVIPSGKTGVDVIIPINTNNYVANTLYALPLKITSTTSGTISGNFGTIIVVVAAQ
jgi:hypothetical protein